MKKIFSIFAIIFISQINGVIAQNISVRGKVIDATNNKPVSFANVVVKGTTKGATTSDDGSFSFSDLEPGYINLEVSFIGYSTTLSTDVLINKSRVPYVEIKLEVSDAILDEVVLTADPFRRPVDAPISMQSIGIKEIESNPGSNRDISRVIQSFPGVGSTPSFRNDVIIRGGGPTENRFFLDDVEIPVLNHFSTQGASGGPVGIINADFIKKVDFYSGSFPASKYNALSGVLDFEQKEGSRDKTNYQFAIGASEAAFTVDGPIGEKTSYMLSMRRSYLQLLFSAIGLPFLPTFNDFQFKVKTDIDERNQISFIGLGALDKLAINDGIENPDDSQEYILSQVPVNNQWSYVFGVVYKNFFDNGYHTVVLSRNMLNNILYKYPDNDESRPKSFDYDSQEAENKFRYELKLNKKGYSYNFSTNLEYAKYNNNTSQLFYVDGASEEFKYSSELNVFKYGVSGQVSKKYLDNKLTTTIGLRFDGNNYNSNTKNLLKQFSPRGSMSYALTPSVNLNAGLGKFYQLPAYTTLGIRNQQGDLLNSDNLEYIGVNQYNLGIDKKFGSKYFLSVEGFYKDYFQYPVDLITGASLANQGANYSGIAGATAVTSTGLGKAYGLEVLNRINLETLNLLASYTFVRSLFTDINGKLIESSWDSRHLLTLTATKDLKHDWRVGTKFRFVGGLPYTPYDLEKSKNVEAWDARGQAYLDYTKLNSERGGNFYQLDLRIDKNFFFSKWTLMVYLDIQNALNFQYKGQDFIVREKNDDGTYKTVNNGTEYILKPIENFSGTVLPTIGVMIKI